MAHGVDDRPRRGLEVAPPVPFRFVMADASGQSLVYTAKTTDCGRHGAARHRNGRSDARDQPRLRCLLAVPFGARPELDKALETVRRAWAMAKLARLTRFAIVAPSGKTIIASGHDCRRCSAGPSMPPRGD